MEFENSGMGRCVVLKESDTSYSLVYAIKGKQFVIVSDLNKETGSWLHGHYFGNDLDGALTCFNERIDEIKKENMENIKEEKER